MTNMHRADESRMITDLSKVSNSDSAAVKVLAGWRGGKLGRGPAPVLADQSPGEEDSAGISMRFCSALGVVSTLTKRILIRSTKQI